MYLEVTIDNKIRVLIVNPNLDTAGSKYVVANILDGLDRSVFDPALGVYRRTYTALEAKVEQRTKIVELPLRLPTRPYKYLPKRITDTARLLKDKYDILHSFDYADSWSDVLAAKLAGAKCIVTKTNMNGGNRRWFLRSLFADWIVCLSNTQKRVLYRNRFWARKTNVINVGIDLAIFSPVDQLTRASIRQEFGWKPNEFILGCVAHLVPVKGHKDLIEAFAQVRQRYSHVRLVLVGGGTTEYEAELLAQIERNGLSTRIELLGVRYDIPKLMQGFDGFILASRKEAFGTVLVEAMATELPVIATRSGGPEDIVVPGETGWLVNSGDHRALADAMIALLSDPQKAQQYGKAGLVRARTLFSREKMVEEYQNLYRSQAQKSRNLHSGL